MKNILFVLLILTINLGHAGGGDYSITINPSSGPTTGGGTLTITGLIASFDIQRVTMGGKDCGNLNRPNNSTIICTIPSGTGKAAVIAHDSAFIQDISGTSHIFTYDPATVFSVNPSNLNQQGGQQVTLNGQNFGTEPSTVLIDGNPCGVTFQTNNTINCTSPAGSGQNLNLIVIQDQGSSTTVNNAFSYNVCPAGTFTKNGQCIACSPGTYQPETDQTSCDLCPAGSFCPDPSTIALCLQGEYAPAGSTSCTPCELGRYQDEVGQSSCKTCQPGFISPFLGANECTACAAGKYIDIAGGIACTDCQLGTFQDLEGQSSCKSCLPGTISDSKGAEACTLCSTGTYQDSIGQATCFACEPGSFTAFSGSTQCTLCPAGSFQSEFGQTSCMTCPDSELQPAEGQTSCLGPGQCDALYGVFFSEFEGSEEVPDN